MIQIFVIGRVYVSEAVFTSKFCTKPSVPGETWRILPTFHFPLIGFWSATITKSLTFTFLLWVFHFFRGMSWERTSRRRQSFDRTQTDGVDFPCGEIDHEELCWLLYQVWYYLDKNRRHHRGRLVFCRWVVHSIDLQLQEGRCRARSG